MTQAALSLWNVGVCRGANQVVRDVSFDVPVGAWMSILGRNGAGKTSLLRAIAGLSPHSGRTTIDLLALGASANVADLHPRQRARLLAYVPQQPAIPEGMTVVDYVMLGRTSHIPRFGVESTRDVQQVDAAIERLDLVAFRKRNMTTLSGGEQQRAVLARALAQEASVLVLDEPTTSLDIGHQQEVCEHIHALRRDGALTVLSSMHDLTLAAQYCDLHVLLQAGRVVALGDGRSVLTRERISQHFGAEVVVDDSGPFPVINAVRRILPPA